MAPWVGVGGICLAVGREWENLMALSLYEHEVTLSIFIFVSFVLRWEESGRTIWLYLCMNLKSLFVFSSLSPLFSVGREWDNYMALSLHEPEVTFGLLMFIFCLVIVCSTHLSLTLLLYRISVSSLVSATRMTAVDKEAVSE